MPGTYDQQSSYNLHLKNRQVENSRKSNAGETKFWKPQIAIISDSKINESSCFVNKERSFLIKDLSDIFRIITAAENSKMQWTEL